MKTEAEIFRFEPLITAYDRVDFHIGAIQALMQLSDVRGYFVICHQSVVKCIINRNPDDPILPAEMLGRPLADLFEDNPEFQCQHAQMVNSVTEDTMRKMCDGKQVSVNYRGETIAMRLSFGVLPNMPEKWGTCRIGVVM